MKTITVDDRQSVVDMWREEGLVCLQCAPPEMPAESKNSAQRIR